MSVKDDGSGIKEEDLLYIYQPFYRSNSYEKTNGFGLGLSLTKKIISLHNGHIEYINTFETGSTFNVTLPLHSKPPTDTIL